MPIDLNDFENIIRSHMEEQPYKCVCDSCGRKVYLDVEIDNDFDMNITVPVCECKGE